MTFAINYEVSHVDEFVGHKHSSSSNLSVSKPRVSLTKRGKISQKDAALIPATPVTNAHQHDSNHVSEGESSTESSMVTARRSGRDRQGQREVSMARTRVRYDMTLVPIVQRNISFLLPFDKWWLSGGSSKARRSSRLSKNCSKCQPIDVDPFLTESVIWVPTKRAEWEDCISEMTALCATAAFRRQQLLGLQHQPAPLSRDYISDRVDIDDPLNGYQVRDSQTGWLQGFLLWTNFTTWTHYFKWDSKHPASEMPSGEMVDEDGSLANALESLPRTGDPLVGGVVFDQVAELGLVGGLGCGEYLVRMALEDIRAQQRYKYVVLQATESSRPFYERFGFKRVGAICRYHTSQAVKAASQIPKAKPEVKPVSGVLPSTEALIQPQPVPEEPPIVGYRHWTHANESDASLQMHGGPSYMMCLPIPPPSEECNMCGETALFLQSMMKLAVPEKPTISPAIAANALSSPAPLAQPASLAAAPKSNSKASKKDDAESEGRPLKRKRKNSEAAPESPAPKKRGRRSSANSASAKKALLALKDKNERIYHSVRGPDGRFTRVPIDAPANMPTTSVAVVSKPKKTVKTPAKQRAANKGRPPASGGGKPKSVDRSTLRKQKVKAYPRTRPHFYNRVVKPADGTKEYFFVFQYNPETEDVTLIPMAAKGTLMGKREGRPRYQCCLGDTTENFIYSNSVNYQHVPATMVMKTPIVSQEAWDVEDD